MCAPVAHSAISGDSYDFEIAELLVELTLHWVSTESDTACSLQTKYSKDHVRRQFTTRTYKDQHENCAHLHR